MSKGLWMRASSWRRRVARNSQQLGGVYRRIVGVFDHGPLDLAAEELEELAVVLRRRGDDHYLGVTFLNLSLIRSAMGELEAGLAAADEAIGRLSSTSAGVELISARLARASALAYVGRMDEARAEMSSIVEVAPAGRAMELAIEVGQTEGFLVTQIVPGRLWTASHMNWTPKAMRVSRSCWHVRCFGFGREI